MNVVKGWLFAGALLLLAAPGHAQERPGGPRMEPPSVVILSDGRRWERVPLRHIDARVLASLLGAVVLPSVPPAGWVGGPQMLSPLPYAGSLLHAPVLPRFQQIGGGGLPPGGPGIGGGPANPAGLPVIVDPITNSLLVDP